VRTASFFAFDSMWPPVDKNSLPTKKEIRSAKETIKKLELELLDAVEAFERAKAHMLRLEREDGLPRSELSQPRRSQKAFSSPAMRRIWRR